MTTLHRLLGSLPGTRHFRHNSTQPLVLDVLVIDEASMIDLEMMHSVLQALPKHARLIYWVIKISLRLWKPVRYLATYVPMLNWRITLRKPSYALSSCVANSCMLSFTVSAMHLNTV